MKNLGLRIKESFRKFLVSIKRNPQMIPLIMLFVAFLVYSLNLTHMSNTTAKLMGKNMGLCQFAIMLFSMLSMVCMLNAFPKRKKPNVLMIVLMFIMFAVMILCSTVYSNAIANAWTREVNRISWEDNPFTVEAYSMLYTFRILICITAALVALLPVYSKLLKKINTNIAVEDNGDMAQIEITD